jgi:dipeptidyl aminopeptidase/acylaminoacyl peptidase
VVSGWRIYLLRPGHCAGQAGHLAHPFSRGIADRITSDNTRVSYPVLLDRRTLVYLATDSDGGGPWLYGMDVEYRIPHRLTPGFDRYTSLAVSADGRRLVATLASPKRTLWRLNIGDPGTKPATVSPVPLTTGAGFSPRLGPDYLLYVSTTSAGDTLWKLAGGTSTELWSAPGARVIGGPAISPDGRFFALSVRQQKESLLYVIRADGTNARIVTNSLNLQGDPAWAPDGRSITSGAVGSGVPHLFRIPFDGSPTPLVDEYSLDPAWAPDGHYIVYSGADVGTTLSVKAVRERDTAHPLHAITLRRGARRVAFMPGGHGLVVLRGDIEHKNLWLVDLDTGAEKQLTDLPAEFDIHDFDISRDGHEVVLEREQERSDVVLIDLQHRQAP